MDIRIGVDRREFLKIAGAGVTAAAALTPRDALAAQEAMRKSALDRIASNSYPIRSCFKTRTSADPAPAPSGNPAGRAAGGGTAPDVLAANPNAKRALAVAEAAAAARASNLTPAQMKAKYGEITMLDFPQFTKDTFPGVTHMDLFSGLFGDVTDDSMFVNGQFEPSTPSGRKWLDTLVARMAATGTKLQHISNNAPTNLAESDPALRKAGVETGKRWLDAAAILGAKSVRMNSPRALGPSIRPNAAIDPQTRYPKNTEIVPLLDNAIESYKEMADYGGDRGVRVTIENHWGLAADPINIRIILEEVNHPYCEASPDFCNWEHEHMLFSGLKALAPYAHTNVHAKYWDRWGENNDVQRATRIMLAGGFKGTFALEYEAGPLNGIEGAKYLYKEVLAALSAPTPVV